MVKKAEYAPGTPSWVDVGSRDLAKTVAFYTGLFGWDAEDMGEEAGHYTMFRLNGLNVAAAGPMMNDADAPAWMSYISVSDIDAATESAESNGAKVMMGPMQVMGAGKMAVLIDPTGAAFSLWQPQDHIGAQLVNEANTFCWSELWTRDMDAAKTFYSTVFGWEAQSNDMGGMAYTEFKLGGDVIAGGMGIPSEAPAAMPPSWLIYFTVEDCDAAVEKATGLGAHVMKEPTDLPMGRFAGLVDPNGTSFAVIKFNG